MRIYEGAPREDYEEVLRSIGAFLDQRGMREILLLEVPDGFVVQGLAPMVAGAWSDTLGHLAKETLSFQDDDVARFLEEAAARRGQPTPANLPTGFYERALRVIGRYLDGQKPQDVFFFEQDGAFVVRILLGSPAGLRHQIVEFTREDVEALVAEGPRLRGGDRSAGPASPAG
jgi:hypothetical protein